MTAAQQLELGLSHHRGGRLAEAEAIYRQVLAEHPNHADALNLLGMLAGQKNQWDIAIDFLQRAAAAAPKSAEAHNNLGFAFASTGRHIEAVASYWNAIRIKPDLSSAHHNLGMSLVATGQMEPAVVAFGDYVRLKPGSAEARVSLGNALKSLGRLDEARESYLAAIQLKPDYASAHANLGAVLRDKRQLDQSIAAYRRAIALKPDLALAHSNLANVLVEVGQFDEARAAYRQAMSLKGEYPTAHSNLILLLLFSPGIDAVMISSELRRWNHQHAEPLKKSIVPHAIDRNPDRRLRIGYVSPDFRDHVIGRNVLPLIREHDHQSFEIFCYGDVARPDSITAQFQSRCDQWRSTVGVSNSRFAEMIRRDQIDILVDLSLHLGNNRLLLFAQKPAPVQMTFAGYPGSTGLDAIDYRLSDPYLDPPGENDAFYREKTIRLAHSFWCYDPATADFPVSPPPSLSNQFITFGCLNNFAKVNQGMIELWSEVLKAVDRSRLILLCPDGSARRTLLEKFSAQGIDPQRIGLTANLPRPKYFEMYYKIDIGLDTVPYNGHTTSLDALWMGVPVVTLVGSTVVGRAGLSQLTNLELTELIARTPQQYVHIAAALASDPSHLAELRQTLRSRMLASPLTDARGFVREIETAFRQMWQAIEL